MVCRIQSKYFKLCYSTSSKWLILTNLSLTNRPYKWRKKCEQRSRPHLTCNIRGLTTVRFITPNTFRRVGLRGSWRQSVTGKSGKFPGACHGVGEPTCSQTCNLHSRCSTRHPSPQHNTPCWAFTVQKPYCHSKLCCAKYFSKRHWKLINSFQNFRALFSNKLIRCKSWNSFIMYINMRVTVSLGICKFGCSNIISRHWLLCYYHVK